MMRPIFLTFLLLALFPLSVMAQCGEDCVEDYDPEENEFLPYDSYDENSLEPFEINWGEVQVTDIPLINPALLDISQLDLDQKKAMTSEQIEVHFDSIEDLSEMNANEVLKAIKNIYGNEVYIRGSAHIREGTLFSQDSQFIALSSLSPEAIIEVDELGNIILYDETEIPPEGNFLLYHYYETLMTLPSTEQFTLNGFIKVEGGKPFLIPSSEATINRVTIQGDGEYLIPLYLSGEAPQNSQLGYVSFSQDQKIRAGGNLDITFLPWNSVFPVYVGIAPRSYVSDPLGNVLNVDQIPLSSFLTNQQIDDLFKNPLLFNPDRSLNDGALANELFSKHSEEIKGKYTLVDFTDNNEKIQPLTIRLLSAEMQAANRDEEGKIPSLIIWPQKKPSLADSLLTVIGNKGPPIASIGNGMIHLVITNTGEVHQTFFPEDAESPSVPMEILIAGKKGPVIFDEYNNVEILGPQKKDTVSTSVILRADPSKKPAWYTPSDGTPPTLQHSEPNQDFLAWNDAWEPRYSEVPQTERLDAMYEGEGLLQQLQADYPQVASVHFDTFQNEDGSFGLVANVYDKDGNLLGSANSINPQTADFGGTIAGIAIGAMALKIGYDVLVNSNKNSAPVHIAIGNGLFLDRTATAQELKGLSSDSPFSSKIDSLTTKSELLNFLQSKVVIYEGHGNPNGVETIGYGMVTAKDIEPYSVQAKIIALLGCETISTTDGLGTQTGNAGPFAQSLLDAGKDNVVIGTTRPLYLGESAGLRKLMLDAISKNPDAPMKDIVALVNKQSGKNLLTYTGNGEMTFKKAIEKNK